VVLDAFIQEEEIAMGALAPGSLECLHTGVISQQAWLGALGIREGPRLGAKLFGFQQTLRDRDAVDLDEYTVGAWAAVMDDPRYRPLAGSRFPAEEASGHGSCRAYRKPQ
jgi:hypothetical protein